MKKIILAIATVLFASGMAYAGSDNYGTDYIPAAGSYPNAARHSMASGAAVDMSSTKSIGAPDSASAGNSDMSAGYGQGIWGH
jgi:Protein of unknown function (DUF680)